MKIDLRTSSCHPSPLRLLSIACLLFATLLVTAARADADETLDSVIDKKIESALLQAGPRALSKAFRVAARHATPAVVTVYSYGQNIEQPSTQESEDPNQPGPSPPQQQSVDGDSMPLTGLGSGVIVSPDGLIITNNHVIAGAKKVVVQLSDETEIEASEVQGDPDSDIAIVRIEREEGFPAANLGDSDQLDIGDWVLAIGSPFRLEATVSAGIISAKNRTLQRIRRGRLLQTDAAINPGNSGGPLVDLNGSAVAISTAIATRNGGYQGIGFAIPINQAKWIADELAAHGKVRRAAMGIRLAELNPKNAKKLNLPTGLGVLVYQIIDGSAADRAGMKPMDVILKFADERVLKPSSLQEVVERKPVGSTQSVLIYRDGEEMTLFVELATLEDPTLGGEDESDNVEGSEPEEDGGTATQDEEAAE
ncbi:Periplasmic serine endoprotease DegP precursor [Novipirellula aureliae]|uniref:Periplasmic serine endoprotease DegP n=1 Tax=Novipirellula aureliae TaxID=2527966 RepID=A0A5C6E2X0_9BACT|nr:trypsin-like peptidase domain-containing protein [Novipirellula aureliae]TWU43208.1 Periplasmic serine endoprotease DegP precursor [Novipirellula aureliae]